MSDYEKQLEKRVTECEEQTTKLGSVVSLYEKLNSFEMRYGKKVVILSWNNKSCVNIIADAKEDPFGDGWTIRYGDIFDGDLRMSNEIKMTRNELYKLYEELKIDFVCFPIHQVLYRILVKLTGIEGIKITYKSVDDERFI